MSPNSNHIRSCFYRTNSVRVGYKPTHISTNQLVSVTHEAEHEIRVQRPFFPASYRSASGTKRTGSTVMSSKLTKTLYIRLSGILHGLYWRKFDYYPS